MCVLRLAPKAATSLLTPIIPVSPQGGSITHFGKLLYSQSVSSYLCTLLSKQDVMITNFIDLTSRFTQNFKRFAWYCCKRRSNRALKKTFSAIQFKSPKSLSLTLVFALTQNTFCNTFNPHFIRIEAHQHKIDFQSCKRLSTLSGLTSVFTKFTKILLLKDLTFLALISKRLKNPSSPGPFCSICVITFSFPSDILHSQANGCSCEDHFS